MRENEGLALPASVREVIAAAVCRSLTFPVRPSDALGPIGPQLDDQRSIRDPHILGAPHEHLAFVVVAAAIDRIDLPLVPGGYAERVPVPDRRIRGVVGRITGGRVALVELVGPVELEMRDVVAGADNARGLRAGAQGERTECDNSQDRVREGVHRETRIYRKIFPTRLDGDGGNSSVYFSIFLGAAEAFTPRRDSLFTGKGPIMPSPRLAEWGQRDA